MNPSTVGPVGQGRQDQDLRRQRQGGAAGRGRPDLRRQHLPVRGLHRRRHKQIIDGLMSSGDVGYFDEDGLLYVSGRDDEMIVSGGENVFPAEVEDLHQRPPRGRRGHRDRRRGQGVGPPAAGLRRQDARAPTSTKTPIKTLRASDNLARYKVPREVIFLDELPRNPTGKILKRELREMRRRLAHPSKPVGPSSCSTQDVDLPGVPQPSPGSCAGKSQRSDTVVLSRPCR